MDTIGIAMVGYGMIGRVHSLGYRDLPLYYPGQFPAPRLAAVCTSRPETAQAAAQEAGFAAWTSDLNALLALPGVDVVDCSVPNDQHKEVILAAIAAGKHVYCEKPLAMNGAEAREIARAAQVGGVHFGMTFNYRFIPAIMRARQLIESGALGQIYSYHAVFYHSGYQDPNRPLVWRMRRERSGGGALVDLGSHIIDLMRYLLGEYEMVRCVTQTYVKERPVRAGSNQLAPVTVDDAAWLQARHATGAFGTLEVSRYATGTLDDLRFEIFGRHGALRFDLMDPNWLYYYDASRPAEPLGGERGWARLETVQSYPGAASPPARTVLGWTRTHAENQAAFLRAVAAGQEPVPGLVDGLRTQFVLDAAYASAESGEWVTVETE